jgi:hypothetical protein
MAMTFRAVRIRVILVFVLCGAIALACPVARAQSQDTPSPQQHEEPQAAQPNSAQQNPPQQQADSQQPSPTAPQSGGAQTGAPATTQAQENQKPGRKTREEESLEHEKEIGTSKDRIFWVIPNFLSLQSSDKNVPVLTTKEKFKVQLQSMVDPYEFFQVAVVAGIGQAANSTPSYGQGMSGYGLRYATAYGDNVTENFIAGAALPSLLHQDPRYYELGHGGFWRRTGHALSRLVITKSDCGKTQFNYSEVMGAGMAAALSSYTYHPQSERTLPNVVTVWGTQMGYDLGTYMLKEFWPDLRHYHRKKKQDTTDSNTTTTTPATPSPTK